MFAIFKTKLKSEGSIRFTLLAGLAFLAMIFVSLSGCSSPTVATQSSTIANTAAAVTAPTQPAPTTTQISPAATNTAVPPTINPEKPTAAPTETKAPPTALPATDTPQATAGSGFVGVKVNIHPYPGAQENSLWLEVMVPGGGTLNGDSLGKTLEQGTLEITLPDGTVKSFKNTPTTPEGLSGMTFENYNSDPGGPEILIPIADVMKGLAAGEYKAQWSSGELRSEAILFKWNGKSVQ